MCLYNYNKEIKKYKHITYAERTMIETWYNSDHKSKKEIAELLHKSERTIRREINRGLVVIRNYDWTEKKEYSAIEAQRKYEYGMTEKGPELKLDSDMELVKHIEKEIGTKLKDIREKLGLTQKQIANECMITQQSYSLYENGKTLVTSLVLYTICYNHKLSIDNILK